MNDEFYPVNLVGEQYCQLAIEHLGIGSIVIISHEEDNEYDDAALVAWDIAFGRLGYVPRDNFLRTAIFEEGRGAFAVVKAVERGQRGFLQVVLNVKLQPETEEVYRVYEVTKSKLDGMATRARSAQ